jgi:hypothetical protein
MTIALVVGLTVVNFFVQAGTLTFGWTMFWPVYFALAVVIAKRIWIGHDTL